MPKLGMNGVSPLYHTVILWRSVTCDLVFCAVTFHLPSATTFLHKNCLCFLVQTARAK
jgi:hypothetical protein